MSTASHDAPARAPARIVDLGRMGYREAHARQLAAVEERKADRQPDTLLFVEHPHVITLGRKHSALANVVAPGDVEVIEVERGGDATYHGPGQIVVYPIVKLGEGERDLGRFLRNLEEGMIRTLSRYGIAAGREPGKTGVWVTDRVPADRGAGQEPGPEAGSGASPTSRDTGQNASQDASQNTSQNASQNTSQNTRKIASIGIACRRWVTFHGLALNVTTDLSYFYRINPCGFDAAVMTSMAAETGRADLDLADVRRHLAADLCAALDRELVP